MSKIKALVLFSGGLDSMLAVKLLQAQQIEVTGVCFVSNFYDCEKARAGALGLDIELKIYDIKEDMLALVKNPPNGYGRHINPCLDCHSMMIGRVGALMAAGGFHVLATGEVLGQRPFSQNKEALSKVQELSGFEVLRPLSAKLLDETAYERQGLVTRGRLQSFSGRMRENQLALAKRLGIKEFPGPDGGCLLTDPEFSERTIKMLDYWPNCNTNDIELMKNGRVIWLKDKNQSNVALIIGRNHAENQNLANDKLAGDIVMELDGLTGPTTLIRGKSGKLTANNGIMNIAIPSKLLKSSLGLTEEKSDEEIFNLAGLLTGYYSPKARGREVKIKLLK